MHWCAYVLLLFALTPELHAAQTHHHQLNLRLIPAENRIEASDKVTLAVPAGGRTISLNPDLERTVKWTDDRTYEVSYSGVIDYPLRNVGEEYARGQKDTAGSIGPDGVYLDGGSGWYPQTPSGQKITFDLTIHLPAGWDAISQGKRTEHTVSDTGTTVRWVCDQPQDGIWLVAGQFTEYVKRFGKVEAMAFFRKPEDVLAGKYLEATGEYLGMYEKLIGDYPYTKFALVENFWETGYGMPSFTLLGPRVIRFPFIIESSYPHEILHNWWGNSVYIDYAAGNWGEGLTAYLSDHLLKEQKGLGVQHRKEVLQKYADYVLEGRDIPLTAFRSRHGSVTEAVGYGKTMMMFHMLRLKFGDKVFQKGLQRFYKDNIYHTAAFDDVRTAFETVSEQKLGWFFDQWTSRIGAPILVLTDTELRKANDSGFELNIVLRQVQEGEPYIIDVPVAVTLDGREGAELLTVPMHGKRAFTVVRFDARPVRVDVDPMFDIFRRLDRREIPPALTRAFGAQKAVVVLPSNVPSDLLESYRSLAESLARTGPGAVEIVSDDDLEDLPADASVWLLGWENRVLSRTMAAFKKHSITADLDNGRLKLHDEVPTVLERAEHSLVLTGRHPLNPDLAVLWIAAANPSAHAGLARKLPHYHKYSYLAFTGDEPENFIKGRWPVVGSPLTGFPDGGFAPRGKVTPGEPLIDRPVPFSAERMMEEIRYLASNEMMGRGIGTSELDMAAQFIARSFDKAGLLPAGDGGTWYQSWREGVGNKQVELKNVIGVLPGTEKGWEGQSVVVGAHYDHLGLGMGEGGLTINRGRVHPGADDNASGVAIMAELTRVLAAGPPPKRTIVFAAFTGEETGKLGSAHFVRYPGTHPVEKTMGMINLDTVGRLGGSKLLVLGGDSASEWVHIFRGAGYVTGVDIQVVKKSIDSSDHLSFIDAGVPAVQLFTGAHAGYHKPTDTVEAIDPEGLVKVAAVAKETIVYLASREEPLTGKMRAQGAGRGAQEGKTRKVSLGTVPDFAYEGAGVRLDGTVEGSPAEKAGLKKGDVITGMNGTAIRTLRDFSDILKSLSAGETVKIEVQRDGAPITLEAVLEDR